MNEVRNIIVGIDFGEAVSQICYYDRAEEEPVSLSAQAGGSRYSFPSSLGKRSGEDVWHFGFEAEYAKEQSGERVLDHLYALCRDGKDVEIDGEVYTTGFLLSVFFKKALQLLGINHPLKNISCIMVTVPQINKELISAVKEAFALLHFHEGRYFIQNYDESFYYYTISQRKDFWYRNVGLFEIDKTEVSFRYLSIDRQQRPAAASVKTGETNMLSEDPEKRDAAFCEMIKNAFGNDLYSGVFLIGSGFAKEWAVHSIPLLCQNQRHVFYGNNLFCKGACYAAKEKAEGKPSRDLIYHSEDMIEVEIGMEMIDMGVAVYQPLFEAGSHWYDTVVDFDILLDGTEELIFMAGQPKSANIRRYSMPLPGLPKRPSKATRLSVHMEFETPRDCSIRVTDKGLGELFPQSGKIWYEHLVQQ